jgi:hypothetical protein
MSIHYIKTLLIAGISSLISCAHKGNNQNASNIPENYYSVSTSSGAKLIIKNNNGPDSISNEQFIYFHVSITPPELPNDVESKEFDYFINYGIQNHFYFLQQKDTIYPRICQRIPSLQKGSFEYELVFEKNENQPIMFLFNDDKYGMGNSIISIKAKDF